MNFKALAPAGNRILRVTDIESLTDLLPGYRLFWVDSGTSALAFSLLQIKERCADIVSPEVIIPGYCCPDLIAAILYIGARPVLVDINPDDPGYDLDQLEVAMNSNTIAVIAVNFMGIRDQLSAIRKHLLNHPQVRLVEDNAQWFPDVNEIQTLAGDYVTFSFGRGKAVSLLGGGLVAIVDEMPVTGKRIPEITWSGFWPLKVILYGVLTTPSIYFWIEKLPMLNLGATEYHPLETISEMSERQKRFLKPNLDAYRQHDRQTEYEFDEITAAVNQLRCLSDRQRRGRLLRYPVLFKEAGTRNEVLACLTRQGLGASGMYQVSLPEISGVDTLGLLLPEMPNAASFARRFMTLPVHDRVNSRVVDSIADNFNNLF